MNAIEADLRSEDRRFESALYLQSPLRLRIVRFNITNVHILVSTMCTRKDCTRNA